jgi:SagB-type dehydrogenase family enzyme
MSVANTIAERRSAERFESRPISPADLSFVLHAIARGGRSRRHHLAIVVVAHRVAELASGAYLFAAETNELDLLREGDLRDRMADACLRQEKARTAAAGIVMAAPLRAGASGLGDRGYRELLIEAGAAAQRVYLAAEALGLAARNLAAYVDEPFNTLLGLDRHGLQALHLTMVGAGS